jgi:hypothetical protein
MKLQELFEGLFNINEAFGLSNALQRRIFKDWDKSKWSEIFGGKYRIYLPFEEDIKDIKDEDDYNSVVLDLPSINIRIGGKNEIINGKKVKTGGKILTKPYDLSLYFSQIEEFLQSKGYQIVDYIGGYATKDGKNKKSIGSLLASEPILKQFFDNDPVRSSAKKSNQMVVISRHPVDIAGMSTDKGWSSCMNLHDGVNKRYVPLDIKEGTIIAYLTHKDDKYIKNTSARVLIKPFYNDANPNEVLLGVSNKIYGTAPENFKNTVISWVNSVNPKISGMFKLSSQLYNDLDDNIFVINGRSVSLQKYLKHLGYSTKISGNEPLQILETIYKDINFDNNNNNLFENVKILADLVPILKLVKTDSVELIISDLYLKCVKSWGSNSELYHGKKININDLNITQLEILKLLIPLFKLNLTVYNIVKLSANQIKSEIVKKQNHLNRRAQPLPPINNNQPVDLFAHDWFN